MFKSPSSTFAFRMARVVEKFAIVSLRSDFVAAMNLDLTRCPGLAVLSIAVSTMYSLNDNC